MATLASLQCTHDTQVDGKYGDPFEVSKEKNLKSALDGIKELCYYIEKTFLLDDTDPLTKKAQFLEQISNSLWANRSDLSLHPQGVDQKHIQVQHEEHILVNDSEKLWAYVSQLKGKKIQMLVDNAGFEIFCDMVLADYLITKGYASEILFHLKQHPT